MPLHYHHCLRKILLGRLGFIFEEDIISWNPMLNGDRPPNTSFRVGLPCPDPSRKHELLSLARTIKLDPVTDALLKDRRWVNAPVDCRP